MYQTTSPILYVFLWIPQYFLLTVADVVSLPHPDALVLFIAEADGKVGLGSRSVCSKNILCSCPP